MSSVDVLNINGKKVKTLDLPKSVFEVEPNDHCIYLDVKSILAARRPGTHKTKERAEVNRTTKKMKRQKGTGGARAGSMKSPLFIGGGTVFGPKPRDYSLKVNKKVKDLARKSALTYKAKDNKITVVENFQFEAPKTKNYIELLKNLQVNNEKTLLFTDKFDKNIFLSSRNLPKVKVLPIDEINTYDIMNADRVIFQEGALSKVQEILN